MRIIISGTRDFDDYELLCNEVDKFIEDSSKEFDCEFEIVSGTCRGADSLGERYAEERGYAVKRFKPKWGEYGRSAGIIRNQMMAGYADVLITFWDCKSRGTMNMIDEAQKRGLDIVIVRYKENG